MARGKRYPEKKILENIYLAPVAVVMALVPLIAHSHVYEKTAKAFLYDDERFLGTEGIDFLNWWKAAFIIGAAVCMLLLLAYRRMAEKKWRFRITAALIPLGAYGFFALLSACFSNYKSISFHGMDGLFESVWVLLAYVVITFYGYEIIYEERILKKLATIFKVGMTALCLYGLAELLWGNPLGWSWTKHLFLSPSVLAEYGDVRELNLSSLFLTFYNSNYVASFLVMTLPLSIILIPLSDRKYNKIWFGLLALVQWILMIASEARSGMVALGISILLLLLFLRKELLKRWKILLASAAVLVIGFCTVEIAGGFKMSHRLATMFTYSKEEAPLERIETLADSLEITYGGETLSLVYQGFGEEQPFVAVCNGEIIPYVKNEEKIWETTDSRFAEIQFAEAGNENLGYFDVGIEGYGWRFINVPEMGGYYYITPDNYVVKLEEAKKALPEKYWAFASGRGYIWAKAIPILKDTILLGSGPDTFYMVYPWNDYVAQSRVMAKEIIFNRAHSMYLQMGIQTGILSLIAFLASAGMYIVSSFRLYWKKQEPSYLSLLGTGMVAGICGYLITGLVNDSIIGVAQHYWLFLGIGMAVNQMEKEQKRKQEEAVISDKSAGKAGRKRK